MQAKKQTLWMVALLVLSAAPALAQDQIPWEYDVDRAKQIAGQQNKLVLLHFWADGCPPCKVVEARVFPNVQVANAIAADFVPVKVHAQRQPAIAKQYGVTRWPTDVIITPAGQTVAKSVSPQNPLQYVSFVKGAAGRGGINSAATQLASNARQRAGGFAAGAAAAAGGAFNPGANNASAGNTGGYQPAAQGGFNPQASNQPQSTASQPQTGYNPQAQGGYNPQAQGGYNAQASNTGGAASFNPGAPTSQAGAAAFAGSGPNRKYDPRGAEQAARKNAAWPPQHVSTPGANLNAQANFNPGQPAYQPPAATPEMQENKFAKQAPAGNQFVSQQNAGGVPATAASFAAGAASTLVDSTPLCLDGFCPVTLAEKGKWQKADPKFGLIHRRRTYQFVDAAAQAKFFADPDRFAPVLSGYDPVVFAETGQLVKGYRKHGLFFRDKIYLFTSEESLEQFGKSAMNYASTAHQAMLRNEIGRRMR